MCPCTSWTANQQDFSFQGHFGWCRVRGGWYSLMGRQTGLGCFSLPLDGRCFVVNFLKPEVSWCLLFELTPLIGVTIKMVMKKQASFFPKMLCSQSLWVGFPLPSQLLPTEFFWRCMAMRLAWQSSHTALGPSIGVSPTRPRLQQKLKLLPTFSFLAVLLFF